MWFNRLACSMGEPVLFGEDGAPPHSSDVTGLYPNNQGSISQFARPSVRPSVPPPVHLSVCLLFRLVRLPADPTHGQTTVHRNLLQPVHPFISFSCTWILTDVSFAKSKEIHQSNPSYPFHIQNGRHLG